MIRFKMLCCAFGAVLAADAAATDGELDPTFSGNGKAVVGFSDTLSNPENALADAIALQNGKIVVAGDAGFSTALTRLNADGSLDTTFSDSGRATGLILKPAGTADSAGALAIQPDGKIVVAGSVGQKGYVMRLFANGGLDPDFSGNGLVTYPASPGASITAFSSVAVTSTGNIIATGRYDDGTGGAPTALSLLLDTSGNILFAQDLATVLTGGGVAMKLQPDDKAVIVGSGVDCIVARDDIGATLTLDPGFGTNGMTTFGWNLGGSDFCTALAFQRDGKILVGGQGQLDQSGTSRATVTRLMPNGMLDAAFGKKAFAFASADTGMANIVTAIVVQQNQDIVLTGIADTTDPAHAPQDFAALRLLPDGSLDTTFTATTAGSSLGKVVFGFETNTNGRLDASFDAVLLGNEIVMAGYRETSNSAMIDQFAVARLKNDEIFADGAE